MLESRETYSATQSDTVYSVSDLNRLVNRLLSESFPLIWVQGEISNLARPSSGHLYFSLKDEGAQVRCAMFRLQNRRLDFSPENGMQVLARAKVGLYENRGEFQLVIEAMEEAGDGALRRAFEALKLKLHAEGLFSREAKKSLPRFPRHIAVITSPTGAAIRDILSVLQRRFPALPVTVYPVPVQGLEAAPAIAKTIDKVSALQLQDVILLSRGGGSLEDLWAFNEEVVARAIHRCQIPLVTGIGHEIDFTIADFAADQRAPTPSAAAELVSPSRDDLLAGFKNQESRLLSLMESDIRQRKQALLWMEKRLIHPGQKIRTLSQRMDDLEQRLKFAIKSHWNTRVSRLLTLKAGLQQHSPAHRIKHAALTQAALQKRLLTAMNAGLSSRRQSMLNLTRALQAVSPLSTLNRGYSITYILPDRELAISKEQLQQGDLVETRLANGTFVSRVEKIQNGE